MQSAFVLLCTDEQFMLNRLANSAIDIYAMVAVLSRASRALEQNLMSARHESMLTKVICDEVITCIDSLQTLNSPIICETDLITIL